MDGIGRSALSVGVALGLAGAYALSRVLASILYEVSPHDARVFIAAPLVLGAIALFAVSIIGRSALLIPSMASPQAVMMKIQPSSLIPRGMKNPAECNAHP